MLSFWSNFKKKHPVFYEVFQWAALVLACCALIMSFISTIII